MTFDAFRFRSVIERSLPRLATPASVIRGVGVRYTNLRAEWPASFASPASVNREPSIRRVSSRSIPRRRSRPASVNLVDRRSSVFMAVNPRMCSRQASSWGDFQSRRYSSRVNFASGARLDGPSRLVFRNSRNLSRGSRAACSRPAPEMPGEPALTRTLSVSSAGKVSTGASPASVIATSSRQTLLSRGIAASLAKPASVSGMWSVLMSSTRSSIATASSVSSVGRDPVGGVVSSRKTIVGSWKYSSPIGPRNHAGAHGWAPGVYPEPCPRHWKSYQTAPPTFLIAATLRRWIDARRALQPSRPPMTSTSTINTRRLRVNRRRRGFEGSGVGPLMAGTSLNGSVFRRTLITTTVGPR